VSEYLLGLGTVCSGRPGSGRPGRGRPGKFCTAGGGGVRMPRLEARSRQGRWLRFPVTMLREEWKERSAGHLQVTQGKNAKQDARHGVGRNRPHEEEPLPHNTVPWSNSRGTMTAWRQTASGLWNAIATSHYSKQAADSLVGGGLGVARNNPKPQEAKTQRPKSMESQSPSAP
jgi:hypothetical protein